MKRIIYVLIGLFVLGGIGFFIWQSGSSRITVHGLVSDDKEDLFAHTDMVEFMDSQGIHVEDESKTTGEIIQNDPGTHDFVILNSEVSTRRFANSFGKKILKEESVFGTPLVLLAWTPAVDVLKTEGLVTEENGVLYADFKPLLDIHQNNKPWESFKKPNKDLYGAFRIGAAHPKDANAGKMAAILVANVYAGPEGITDANMANVTSQVHQFFQKIGYMDHNPQDQFNGILKKSWTQHPVTLVYENQLIEYAVANPQVWEANKARLRLIYIKPTLWAEIHVIALTKNGVRFLDAMHDINVQNFAGSRHGMRTGVGGDIKDSELHQQMGIAPTVGHVTQLPSNSTMNQLLNQLPNY